MARKKTDRGSETPDRTAGGEPYVVLARKYRPQTFDDLIGQEAMVATLRNAFASGRIAHGYMLTGVRGIGKTTTARILARALNYETDTVSAPTVDMPVLGRHCAEIMESRHADVVEMDAASNTGVDNMREIIESARYRPMLARTKVFIIDEVHMLSKGAFNALLKTLEEPPGHVKFIFATTEIRKVPVTVLSRCQRFDLRRVDPPLLARHLGSIASKEGAEADPDALALVARAAQGSVRDGLSILDQAIAMSLGPDRGGKITATVVRDMLGLADRGRVFDLIELIFAGDAKGALGALAALYRDGADPLQLLGDLAEAVHITTRVKTVGTDTADDGLARSERERAAALGGRVTMALLARAWQMLIKGIEDAGRAPDPQAAAEMVVIRLAYTADLPPPEEIARALGQGSGASPRAPTAPPAPGAPDRRAPLNAAASPPTAIASAPPVDDLGSTDEDGSRFDDDAPSFDLDSGEPAEPHDAEPVARSLTSTGLRSFEDVVALVSQRRDARLKVHLEEHVSLVGFDAAAGAIDLFLLEGAPKELANDLREKLNRWTGRRWVVMLSKEPGQPALGQARREREAADLAQLKSHPAVAAVMDAFPEAEITVRPLTVDRDDDSAVG